MKTIIVLIRFLLIFFLILTITGCSIAPEMNQSMASWEKFHYSKVIAKWGPPDQILEDEKNNKIISWINYHFFTSPGHATTHTYGFTGTAYTTYNPPTVSKLKATKTFWVDSNGIIYDWAWTSGLLSGSKAEFEALSNY